MYSISLEALVGSTLVEFLVTLTLVELFKLLLLRLFLRFFDSLFTKSLHSSGSSGFSFFWG